MEEWLCIQWSYRKIPGPIITNPIILFFAAEFSFLQLTDERD
jgi:hypothetical protein